MPTKHKKTIAFDVDDTLIRSSDASPIKETIGKLKTYVRKGYKVMVWSGAGKTHAQQVGKYLKLKGVTYHSKHDKLPKPDITYDDEVDFDKGIKIVRV